MSSEEAAKKLSEASTSLVNAQSFTMLRVEGTKTVETTNFNKPDQLKQIFQSATDVSLTAVVIGDNAWSQYYATHKGEFVQSTTESGKALIADTMKKVQALQAATNVKSKDGYMTFDVSDPATGFASGRAQVSDGNLGEVELVDANGTSATYVFQSIGRLTEITAPPPFAVRGVDADKRCSIKGSPEDKQPC